MDNDFEEESIAIPTTITFDNVQIFILVIDHEVTSEPQHDIVELSLVDHVGQHDHIEILPIQDEVVVPEQQTQQPQEHMPLWGSIRERKKAILGDYIIFL